MNLSDKDRRKLIALLGKLGSDNVNEQAACATAIERFRQEHKITWDELLSVQPVIDADAEPPYSSLRVKRIGVIILIVLDIGIVLMIVAQSLGYRIAPTSVFLGGVMILCVTIGWPLVGSRLLDWWDRRSNRTKGWLGGITAFLIGGIAALLAVFSLLSMPD